MDGHLLNRFAKPGLAAALAVMLVVPSRAATCCDIAKESEPSARNCCHQSPDVASTPASTHASCGSTYDACKCICCRPAVRQATHMARPTDGGQPDLTPALDTIPSILSAADASAAITSDLTALAGVLIPHRILHCSWLI